MSKRFISFLIALSILLLFLVLLIIVNFDSVKGRYKEIELNLENYSTAEILILSFERIKTELLRYEGNNLDDYFFRINIFKSKIKLLDNKSNFYYDYEFIKIKNDLKNQEIKLSVLSKKLREGKIDKYKVLSYMNEIDNTLLDLQEVIYNIQIRNFKIIESTIRYNSNKAEVLAISSLFLIFFIVFIMLKNVYSLRKVIINKNLFISFIYHELSSSTQAIIIASDIIKHELIDNELKEEARIISHHATKIIEQTKEVMDYSLIEMGKVIINKTHFSINKLVYDAIYEVSKNSKNKFRVIISSNNINIISDKYKLYRIIFNLLDNSNKYTQKGVVTINVKIFGKKLFFLVKDNGIGFNINNLNHLFKAFNQGSKKETKQGLGIGLTIIKYYIKLLKGKILVKSKIGFGSSFFIFIPIDLSEE